MISAEQDQIRQKARRLGFDDEITATIIAKYHDVDDAMQLLEELAEAGEYRVERARQKDKIPTIPEPDDDGGIESEKREIQRRAAAVKKRQLQSKKI